MPESFPDSLKAAVTGLGAKVIKVGSARQLLEKVRSTGELGSSIIEQSLVIDTSNGPVLITGCAHPGIVNILNEAGGKGSRRILLVLGGFHLLQTEPAGIREIIGEFRKAGVKKVGPTYCTGDDAIAMFLEAWGGDFVNSGCGAVISLDK
jgi:7,8-dihydropterin-6-yl-methyl-4-(beta-D-ribofuranosyl)aminobenzene 5'-phosphate synthase